MSTKKGIVIVGPTASGKSDLAVEIALFLKKRHISAEIISGDSRQIYKEMDLGTGKITKKEMKGISHHMLDISSPRNIFTVSDFQKIGRKKLEKIMENGGVPIVCGGTGFYIDALLEGVEIPEVKADKRLREKLKKETPEKLFSALKKLDPERAKKIDPKNKVRLIRAIEIAKSIGSVPKIKKNPIEANFLRIGILKNKEELGNLIEKRLKKRLKLGMLREIKKLHKKGVSWKRMESMGLEYRYGARFLQGKIKRAEFFNELFKETKKYAKRQMTWFRKNKDIRWIRTKKEVLKLMKDFLKH